MGKLTDVIKGLLFFSEPKKSEHFILKENKFDKVAERQESQPKEYEHKKKKNESLLLDKGDNNQVIKEAEIEKKEKEQGEKPDISSKLSDNLERIKEVFSIPVNGDIILREFDIVVKEKVIPAFIVFVDGMSDRKIINDNILQPLMLLSNIEIKGEEADVAEFVRSHLLPHNQLTEVNIFQKVVDEVNFGGCGLFIDGAAVAFAADVKGWEHRGVERPNTELVIRGPQEGFTEILRVNTALIRKRMKDVNVIAENIEIGKRSKTPCSMMYVKDIANDSLIREVRKRLKGIKVDYLNDSGELEQFIEDSTFLPSPQIIATERPDKVASMLGDGKVAVIVHGSPFALIMPVTFVELMHSPEDAYSRFPYANLLRIIRILGMLASLLLPGMYLAITNYHQEMIPTDLLLAIEASREKVPFPSIIEILIMEIAFELIREAGIRIPGPIGPTLGIIGALILGQAAVAANIVSPILIIIVAVTGIGSFAVPNFSLALAFRILRFGFIFLGAAAGFLGITTGIFIYGMYMVATKSFGVPLFAPFAPRTAGALGDTIVKGPIWKQERRPDYVNTKRAYKQPVISRGWAKPADKEKKDGKE